MVSLAGSEPARSRIGEVVRGLDREVAADLARAAEDRLADHRRRDHLVVEHDGEGPADVLLRHVAELARARGRQAEVDDRLVGLLVEGGLGVDQVLAGHQRHVVDDVGDAGVVDRTARRSCPASAPAVWPRRRASARRGGRSAGRSGRRSPSAGRDRRGPAPRPGCGRCPGAGCSARWCRVRRCGG